MAAASKNLTLLVSSPRLSLSRAHSLSTLASSPLLGDSRAKLPLLVRNVVPFNFSTAAAVSSHVHSSSPACSSCPIFRTINYSRIYNFADESEYTVMAWEGIEKARDAAQENNLEWWETEHLMKALLEQKDGLARRIFSRAGLDHTSILRATHDFLSKHRKVSDDRSNPVMGQYLSSLLENARKHKNDMKDEFVSVEHLILAFHLDRRFGQRLLRNLSEKDLQDAIDAVRVGRGELNDQWGIDKELMNRIRTLKEEIDGFNVEKEARTLMSLQRELEEAEGHLAEIESKWTGTHFEDFLKEFLVGQNEAVTSVADAIRRSRAGLSHPNRPMSFMFICPSYYDIEYIAETLAGYLFNSEKAIVKIPWIRCMGKGSVSRLVGPSRLDYFPETCGPLTELVRRRPHCVLLFDQIEKTPQDILNIVSQILEKGRITDYQGRTVSFKNTVIILKSHNYDIVKKPLLDSDPPTFLHEFMNHIDHCIVFDANATKKIAETKMSELEEKLKQRNVELHYTKEVIDTLAKCSTIACEANWKIEEFMEHSIARRKFKKEKVCVLNVELNPDLRFVESFGKPTRKRTHFLFYVGGRCS